MVGWSCGAGDRWRARRLGRQSTEAGALSQGTVQGRPGVCRQRRASAAPPPPPSLQAAVEDGLLGDDSSSDPAVDGGGRTASPPYRRPGWECFTATLAQQNMMINQNTMERVVVPGAGWLGDSRIWRRDREGLLGGARKPQSGTDIVHAGQQYTGLYNYPRTAGAVTVHGRSTEYNTNSIQRPIESRQPTVPLRQTT
ncbi:hypothetical protein ACCO45_006574 [Purpureocillium lilacinum]|uniref:Uncharacterized protein n=1 Tax=Purpureocillium lilacinum TaxID=33203 RepID=A0ACC4DRA3_PURLI